MRIEQLTFTRFVAALAIVVFHFGSTANPFAFKYVNSFVSQLNSGVSYFFMLSGFIMIISYWDKGVINWIDYIKNRMARVYPIYFIGIFAALFISIIKLDVNLFDIFFNVIMMQSWIPGRALTGNPPGWSICVEFLFYCIFPFLFNLVYKPLIEKHLIKINLVVVLVFIFSQFIFLYFYNSSFYKGFPSQSHDMLFFFPLMHLSEFLIGNLAGLFFIKYGKDLIRNYDIPLVILVLILVTVLSFPLSGLSYFNGLLAFIIIPIILLLSMNNGKITQLFSRKSFVFLGEISYSLYILQFPFYVYLRHIVIYNVTVSFFVKLFVLIIISSLTYLYIEKPLRRTIKNLKFQK